MARPTSLELDKILGLQIKVLDDGFVRVVDYMGNDSSIVQAARVSYGEGTKHVQEDRALIRYLLRNRHTTPFEMCEIKFHVRVPMDCWRQWIRHRTASVNEYSTRYSVAIDSFQRTEATQWRIQSSRNKQGSADDPISGEIGEYLTAQEIRLLDHARQIYQERLEKGVAREQARKDLPLSTYTEAYWKIDLHNLLHFLDLRLSAHAQAEIRAYAEAISTAVRAWCPTAWTAFQDYRMDGLSLSVMEVALLRQIMAGEKIEAIGTATAAGFFDKKSNRERSECETKLARLGITPPWNE